jgi:hypothetical protein
MLGAELLGIGRDQMVGLLVRYWIWLDKNLSRSCPDFVPHLSQKSLDELLQCPGFAATLDAIGWAKFDGDARTLQVAHAERHNGKTAKTRAMDQKKKARNRPVSVPISSRSRPDVVPMQTGPEKRRSTAVNLNPPTPLSNGTPGNGESSNVRRVLEREQPTAENRTAEDPWPRRIPEITDQHALDECAKAYGIDVRARHFGSYAELQTACFTARNRLREARERDHARH